MVNDQINFIWAFVRCIKVIGTDFEVPLVRIGGFAVNKRAGERAWILASFPPGGGIAQRDQGV